LTVYWIHGEWVSKLKAIEALERFFHHNGHVCYGVNGVQECRCRSLTALKSMEVSEAAFLSLKANCG